MIITFLAPTTPYPIGGVAVLFEYANALTARGHSINILHHGIFGNAVSSLDEIGWFDFDERISHHFTGLTDPESHDIPSADIFFGYTSDGRLEERFGLPVVLIQGFGMFAEEIEGATYRAPCPKVCVAKWLVDVGRERYDVPAEHMVHLPYGMDHDRFRVTRPIERRPRTVTFLHHTHRTKGTPVALAALKIARERIDDLEVRAFGTFDLPDDFPDWIEHDRSPSHAQLVEIFNRSSVFLSASHREGFGLPAVEAMACGAALVTTASGGAGDYAFHGETAMVAPTGDADALGEHLVALLTDDTRRIDIARAGREFVQRYDWATSAQGMERFLTDYLADPARFGSGVSSPSAAPRTNYPSA